MLWWAGDENASQAICMHPILLNKVKKWAQANGGLLICKRVDAGQTAIVTVGELDGGEVNYVPSAVKSVQRAVEKVTLPRMLISICAPAVNSFLVKCLLSILNSEFALDSILSFE